MTQPAWLMLPICFKVCRLCTFQIGSERGEESAAPNFTKVRLIFRKINFLAMSWKKKLFFGIFPLLSKTHSVLLLCGGEILLMLKATNKSCKASLFDGRIDLVSQAWTKCSGIHCGINQDLPSDEISICLAELFCCLNEGWVCKKKEIDQKLIKD